MWRHEDFFYACCLGGSRVRSDLRAGRDRAQRRTRVSHEPARARSAHARRRSVAHAHRALRRQPRGRVHRPRTSTRRRVLDLAVAEHATTIGIIGDAMARPLAEAVLAEPDRWDCSEIIGLGNGGAMLSASVKTQLARRVPERGVERQLRRVGDRRGRAARSARAPNATGPASPPTGAPGCSIPTRSNRSSPVRASRACSRARVTSRSGTGTIR